MHMNWKHLESIEHLENALTESNKRAVMVFKHSTRCSVSVMVKRMLESQWSHGESISAYYLDLLNHRDISNEIASRFDIYHQSPQAIVFRDGTAVHNASHSEIDQSNFPG